MPVALNLYEIRDAKTPAGDFFRRVQRQRPEQYQGIYVVSPEGKLLASQGKQPERKDWARDLFDVLRAGLATFGEVTPRKPVPTDPLPHRGYGLRSDDSILLTVATRPMVHGLDPRGIGSLTVDRITLTAPQVASLTLADATPGETFQVPAATVRQFYPLLSPSSDRAGMPRASEVTLAELRGRVDRVEGGIATLSFTGKLGGHHVGEFDNYVGKKSRAEITLVGVGTCDARRGRLLTFTLAGDGTYRHFPPYDQPQRFGGVADWRRRR